MYFEVLHVENRGDKFPVQSPFMAAEIEQPIALELPNDWMGFVAVEEFCFRDKHLADEIRVGNYKPRRRAEPEEKGGA